MESRIGNFLQDMAEEGGILAVFRPTTTQDCRKLTAGFAVFILWLGSKDRLKGRKAYVNLSGEIYAAEKTDRRKPGKNSL
jgi:sorbitol-specific phosphotransferase system component IIA